MHDTVFTQSYTDDTGNFQGLEFYCYLTLSSSQNMVAQKIKPFIYQT